jgi:cysteine-rich repeat protein
MVHRMRAFAVLLAACADDVPAPMIASVSPPDGPALTRIAIRGRFGVGRVQIDFTSSGETLDVRLDARLGGRALDPVYRDQGLIEAIVPELEPGPHDLEIHDGYGEAILRSAFTLTGAWVEDAGAGVEDAGRDGDAAAVDAEPFDAGTLDALPVDVSSPDVPLIDAGVLDALVLDGASGFCGDDDVGVGEECDDGNTLPGDGCFDCRLEFCGDGRIGLGEACDDLNTVNGDGCDFLCQVEPGYVCGGMPSACVAAVGCGNGIIEPPESCDDANAQDADGCSAACGVEPGWTCDVCSPSYCELGPGPIPVRC